MLTFFWSLYAISVLLVFMHSQSFFLSFKPLSSMIIDLLHTFSLYGLLDQIHPMLSAPWIWIHQSCLSSWILTHPSTMTVR